MLNLKPQPQTEEPPRRAKKPSTGLIDLAITGLDPDTLPDLEAYKVVGAESAGEHVIVHTGDIWLLGDHRLICGDSTDANVVARLLNGERPHLCVTDQPFGVNYDPNWRNEATRADGTTYGASAVGTVSNDNRVDWSDVWRLFPGDVIYTWSAPGPLQCSVHDNLVAAGYDVKQQIVWVKQQFAIGRGAYHYQHEICWYAVKKGRVSHYNGDRTQSTTWFIDKPKKSDSGHSTQKPIECMKRPIENNSQPGDAVYEPFCGSGTTIIAAEMTQRRCYAIELNPLYVYVAINRWQMFTGKLARLEATGETFSEVLLRRSKEPRHVTTDESAILHEAIIASSEIIDEGEPPPQPLPLIKPSVVIATPPARRFTVEPRPQWTPVAWTIPTEPMRLDGVKRLAFDTEGCDPKLKTEGPGTFRGDSFTVGFSLATDDGRRGYFPYNHQAGGNCEWDVLAWAKSELAKFDGELVGANLLYDLEKAAVEWDVTFDQVRAFHDVQVAEPLIDEWRFSYALEALAQDYLGEGKDETTLKAAAQTLGAKDVKSVIWRMPGTHVGAYGEADADLPLRILAKQLATIEAEGLQQVYEVERKLIPVLLGMRLRGVRVDVPRAQKVRDDLVVVRDEKLAQLRRLAGSQAEFMAVDSFANALADRGLKYPLTKKSGRPSITKDWLAANAGDELVDTVLYGRRVNTIVNTFFDGHILGHATQDGRIHCQFHQLKGDEGGTIARFSSSQPNLQNLPARDEELAPLIRSVFIPEDGELWEKQDLSQIEYRYLAHYAYGEGAEEARAQYNNDPSTDYHKLVADMCGIDPEDKMKRKGVKSINFAKGYGAGRDKLVRMLRGMGLSDDDANHVYDDYERKLPFAKATYHAVDKRAQERGFITTILGRRQRFPLWGPGFGQGTARTKEEAVAKWGSKVQRAWTYKALNRLLQGGAADHMKKAMVDIWEAGINKTIGAPLITVHDELDYSFHDNQQGNEALAEAKRIMETCITLKVPVLCESERGKHWGET